MAHNPNTEAMGGFLIISFTLAIIIFSILWLYTLTDILKSRFTGNTKIIWFLLIFFLPPLGVILYFLIGRDQKLEKPNQGESTPETIGNNPKATTKNEAQKNPSALTMKP